MSWYVYLDVGEFDVYYFEIFSTKKGAKSLLKAIKPHTRYKWKIGKQIREGSVRVVSDDIITGFSVRT
jgi:hypothetical protein